MNLIATGTYTVTDAPTHIAIVRADQPHTRVECYRAEEVLVAIEQLYSTTGNNAQAFYPAVDAYLDTLYFD